MSRFLIVVMMGLCYCSKESSQSLLGRPKLLGPSVALIGDIEEFNCELKVYPKNESILLQLFKVGSHRKFLGDYTSLDGETAVFLIIIQDYHDGNLECVARAQNNSDIEPTVSYTHHLRVIDRGMEVDMGSSAVEIFEGRSLKLKCLLKTEPDVSYEWLLDERPLSQSPFHTIRDDYLLIYSTTSANSGLYKCVATNSKATTKDFTSMISNITVVVKDFVSEPEMSFTVLKEDSHNYSALVTCRSTKGTPPITFSLTDMQHMVARTTVEERYATFKIALQLDQHDERFFCMANNSKNVVFSQSSPLVIVPVAGPVELHYELYFENYAVTALLFYCKAAKGSHPQFQWFFNSTLLHEQGSFYHTFDQAPEQSILILSVEHSSSGTYHCEVSNNFDNTTTISSKKWYFDKNALNAVPVSVVAIIFGSSAFLVLLVSWCCCMGVMFRRRQYGDKSLVDMGRMVAVHGNELDLSEYTEDADVVKSANDVEFDQASQGSGDDITFEEEPLEEP
ncbi:platelet endothelial cell adhesion molecule [Aulostomus maculatus]